MNKSLCFSYNLCFLSLLIPIPDLVMSVCWRQHVRLSGSKTRVSGVHLSPHCEYRQQLFAKNASLSVNQLFTVKFYHNLNKFFYFYIYFYYSMFALVHWVQQASVLWIAGRGNISHVLGLQVHWCMHHIYIICYHFEFLDNNNNW